MYAEHLLLWWLVISLAHGENTTESSDQEASYIDLKTNQAVNIEEFCKKVPCLVKCCPMNEILLRILDEDGSVISKTCISNADEYAVESPYDYSNKLDIYNKDIKKKIIKTNKTLMDFNFLYHEKYNFMNCCQGLVDPSKSDYLTEDGRLLTSRINHLNNWLSEVKPEDFCFENEIVVDSNDEVLSNKTETAFYGIVVYLDDTDPENLREIIAACGMLVSCWFMVLVLVVYGLVKDLRNLEGLMLMSYLATLFSAFLIRAIQIFTSEYGSMNSTGCIVIGLLLIYTAVASFTWMNTMSLDIWLSVRGFRERRRITKRGIPTKFVWYCLYAWGVPLILLLFIVIVEHLDLSHLPDFVKPHFIVDPEECFIPADETQLYLYAPITIATIINIVLFLTTAYNIWRTKSGVNTGAESKRNKKDETRFLIYLRLSMVSGISWILEVMSSLVYPDSPVWYISDIYNTLIGVFIFIMFVCKKSTLKLLCTRFQIDNEYVNAWHRGASSAMTTGTKKSKRNVADSETDNSNVGDFSATEHLNYLPSPPSGP